MQVEYEDEEFEDMDRESVIKYLAKKSQICSKPAGYVCITTVGDWKSMNLNILFYPSLVKLIQQWMIEFQ